MTQSRPVLVDPGEITIETELICGLPVVNAVLERLGLAKLLEDHLPEPDPRCELTPAQAIGVLVANLCLGRQPLYGLCAWAGAYDPTLLGLALRRARRTPPRTRLDGPPGVAPAPAQADRQSGRQ